jgi:glycosyltransferase involved in cell wall biosynthesis
MPRTLDTVVIIIDHGHVNGGSAKVAIESAIGLANRGQRVIFFCAAGPVDSRLERSVDRVVCLGQRDILTNPSRLDAVRNGLWNSVAGRSLAELLSTLPADRTVIHVHGWTKALSPAIFSVIKKSQIPSVITFHDYFYACPNGAFYLYQKDALCTLKPMSAACLLTSCDSRKPSHKFFRVARQLIQTEIGGMREAFGNIVFVSELSRSLLSPYCAKTLHSHVITNPVNVEPNDPARPERNSSFVAVGRSSAEKGCLHFAEAARRADIDPCFVGDGPQRTLLEQRYPKVSVSGWVAPEAVCHAIRAARAVVFPSLWYETHGLAVAEALGNGIPVIVSDSNAAAEQVEDGENGLLYPRGDVESLAESLRKVAENDALVIRLGRKAHSMFWQAPPTLEVHVNALTRLYKSMLNP